MNKCYWIPVDLYEALEDNPNGILCETRGADPYIIKIVKPEKTEAKDDDASITGCDRS